MIEYRVTKYNPAFRNARGAYPADEWTSFSDIGRDFFGSIFTDGEYRRVEQAYIEAALAFIKEGKLTALRIEGLENPKNNPLKFINGSLVFVEQLGDLIRQILEEQFWCRLEALEGFIHFGWDYYMYIGVPHRCPAAEQITLGLGLYPENFDSPYKEEVV